MLNWMNLKYKLNCICSYSHSNEAAVVALILRRNLKLSKDRKQIILLYFTMTLLQEMIQIIWAVKRLVH